MTIMRITPGEVKVHHNAGKMKLVICVILMFDDGSKRTLEMYKKLSL